MSEAVKVGLFAFLGLAILAFFILRIEDFDPFAPEGQKIYARFDTVAGLDDKAAVRIAGVRVGRVDGVSLEEGRAQVGLKIESPGVELTEGTRAKVSTLGLLGESYVNLLPGPADAPPLPPGAVIPGESPRTMDEAMEQLTQVGESIQEITGSFSSQLSPEGNLALLIEDLGATASSVRGLVETNREQVTATVGNFEEASAALARELPKLSTQMERVLGQIEAVVAENRPEMTQSMANVERITEDLQISVKNLNEITGRLNRGEGSLGKLLTSEEAHDSLVSTLDSIEGGVTTLQDTLGAVQKIRLDLGAESYWLSDPEEAHSTFQLTIDPQSNGRLYRVGLVDDPRGDEETTFERITVTNPDGTTETRTIETLRRDDDPTFTALFGFEAKRGARLWGGLIEDQVGFQVDYPLLDRRLWLSLEAFDFDREIAGLEGEDELNPHLRLMGKWWFHDNFYLTGGFDDFLESDRDSYFLGGGVRWNDDNLKTLLGSVPRF